MGVGIEQVDHWLDICQDIATETVSNHQFVSAALHLAQLEAETGYDPESLIRDFKAKHETTKMLDAQTQQEKADLTKIQEDAKKEKEKSAEELDSIHNAIEAAKKTFASQTKDLKSKLDDYVIKSQLSWDKVNTVLAILRGELSKAGFSEDDKETITMQIAQTGSLIAYTEDLEDKKKTLEEKCEQFSEENQILEKTNTGSKNTFHELAGAILAKMKEQKEVENLIQSKKSEFTKLEELRFFDSVLS